jgi:hypothetical protein
VEGLQAGVDCGGNGEATPSFGITVALLIVSWALRKPNLRTPHFPRSRRGAGDASFVWQVEATRSSFEVIATAERDARLMRALDRIPLLCATANVRLLAAAAYLHKASRLIGAGTGPSEFAAEAVINLAKCLEALFPARPNETRSAVRRGLAVLGYGSDVVDGTFVKSLLLRSSLDAAHVRMATLTGDERRKLQLYMEGVLGDFRRLLSDLTQRAADGELDLAPYENERTADDDLARLISSL